MKAARHSKNAYQTMRTSNLLCYLHIGGEKTGTSSLQASFARSRASLAQQGVFYCHSLGNKNHRALATCAMRLDRRDFAHVSLKLHSDKDRQRFQAQVKTNLRNEIGSLRRDSTFIISSEQLQSRLIFDEEIDFVKEALSIFDRVTVILYLRPQIDVAISRYSMSLRSGESNPDVLNKSFRSNHPYYDYLALDNRWSNAFGAKNVIVRNFDECGDIVGDFSGLLALSEPPISVRLNESLTLAQARFLKLFNSRFPLIVGGEPNKLRRRLLRDFADSPKGTHGKLTVDRRSAMEFQSRFDERNELLRQKRFPDRDTLFEIDFNKYPKEVRAAKVTDEEIFDILAYVIKRNVKYPS